jgi:hypothetical protein
VTEDVVEYVEARAQPESSLVEMVGLAPSMEERKSRANWVIRRRIRAPCWWVNEVNR